MKIKFVPPKELICKCELLNSYYHTLAVMLFRKIRFSALIKIEIILGVLFCLFLRVIQTFSIPFYIY